MAYEFTHHEPILLVRYPAGGNSRRRRPSGIHDAQRPHRRHGRADRLLAGDPGTTGRACRRPCRRPVPASEHVAGSRRREEGQGSGDDHDRRVLQGRARALELAHHRADAHHLRLLPALHQAAGRSARQGDRRSRSTCSAASAPPARATAPSAPRWPASSARSRRRSIPRSSTSLAAKPDQTFPVKLGDKTFNAVAQGHHLRRAQGRLPAPEHDDLQADGGRHGAARAGVLLGRRRLHRVEGLRAAEEGRSRSIPTRRWRSC